jgi:hypothetical protein
LIASSYLAGTTRRVRRVTNLRFGLIIGALQICDLPAFCGVDFEYLPAKGSVVRIDSVIAEFYLLEDLLKNMRIGELIGALNYSDNEKRPFAVDPRY